RWGSAHTDRRGPNGGYPPSRRQQPSRRHHHASLTQGKAPDRGRCVQPAGSECAGPAALNSNWIGLADNIKRLNLTEDQIVPLHSRIVSLTELNKLIGR